VTTEHPGARWIRRAGFALAFLVVGVVSATVSSAPAGACSCAGFTEEMSFERADVVFVGEVQGVERPSVVASSTDDPAVWTFSVDEVFKGDAARTQGVVTDPYGSSCGLELPTSGAVVVYARHDADPFEPVAGWDTLHASLCDGSRAWDGATVPAGFGSPHPPTEGSAGLAPLAVTLRSDRSIVMITVVVVAVAVALTVVLVVRRRRRRRAG
jgi:hypothetical protein